MTREGIGGSDAAAALGLDPHKSRVRLWLEKTGRVEPEPAGEAAKWGQVLEPLLAAELRNYGYQVVRGQEELTDRFMTGHIDGFVYREGRQRGLVELKTCSLRLAHHWDDDSIPIHYQAQGAHYLALTDATYVVYGCLIGGQRFVVREMPRDEQVIAAVVEREREFWEYVERDEPPPVDGATPADLAALWPHSETTTVALDDAPAIIDDLLRARRALKAAESEVERCEAEVKGRLGAAETGTLAGLKVVSWKSHESSRVDTHRLREDNLYEKYARSFSVRPFRIFK